MLKRSSVAIPLSNENGVLTVDFMFSMVLVMGLFSIMLALALTLSMIEVTQYVSFASARNYHAGHFNQNIASSLAQQKYNELMATPAIAPLFREDGWFIARDFEAGNFNGSWHVGNGDSDTFHGVEIQLVSKVLEIEIPGFGSTTDTEDGFTANIRSFLSQEPMTTDCLNFNNSRWQKIIQNLGYTVPSQGGAAPIRDNGC